MHQQQSGQPHPGVNVLLLAGFLGSGKTTLLKRILSWQADLSDTVVLVNEFGNIQAWEKEDIVEPNKPNAAGWIIPDDCIQPFRFKEVR